MMDLQSLSLRDETVVNVGFFDLLLFTRWSEGRPPRELLDLASGLFQRTGRAIDAGGGKLIKAIGDAGLFVFAADDPDGTVRVLKDMRRACDAWLAHRGYPGQMVVKVQLGPVAGGQVGAPGDERFDVYGSTVNHAAMMRGCNFTLSAELVAQLQPELQKRLKRFGDDEYVAVD